jgi:D-threo-aldose 1-dehydrogenase
VTAPVFKPRALGRTGLVVPALCLGTSPLASMPGLYGYEVRADTAEATIEAAISGPLTFLDTSNNYGGGTAESRIGAVLRRHGGVPPGVVLATKVDADPETGDFSGDRVRRSVEESLARLGVSSVQLMYLHDPEYHVSFEQAVAPGGPVEALVSLRDQGVLEHLGIAGGPIPLMRDFVRTDIFEVVLNHNRFTLLDRSATPLMEDAVGRGVAFVNGAPYGGGMLARGPDTQPRYAYRETAEEVRDAAGAMQRLCAEHGVPLAAAALQFSLRDPRVTSTIVGLSDPERIQATVDLATTSIPDDLWIALEDLALPADLWLG